MTTGVVRVVVAASIGLLVAACSESEQKAAEKSAEIPTYRIEVVNTYPHDPKAFTQGLLYHDGYLYESTGQRGESTVRKVDLESGEVVLKTDLAPGYFGEGLTLVGDRLVQLTWTSQKGLVYELSSLRLVSQFRYLTQGWGIVYDGTNLVMSDGSATLQLLDPVTYEYVGFRQVRANGAPVMRLNELEYIDGEIWANIWPSSTIARIDPKTGDVVGWVDASGLRGTETPGDTVDVLNGIAWDAEGERLFLTGKYWPSLYQVRVTSATDGP